MLYRPDCPDGCRACVPIRVPLADFAPSRSQRRLLARLSPRVVVSRGRPRFDSQHLALYNRHARMVSTANTLCSPTEYELVFVNTCVTTHLVEYRIDGQFAGLSVVDKGHRALSSFYFCWEPRLARFSLGTFSALWEIQWAQQQGLSHYYLGYWIADCPSMSYKNRFRPYELRNWHSGAWTAFPR
jgi:arginine-tRNA-protein transferase